ncbi:hypothetical protein GQ43DRAFT_173417 [Delitschia confertaspora ATCC 74209]|uniref:Uncharacterized protein n=1 Tax=Delitschia confertaspora ATCC 74209 TaxID=1513339 RepID=A0A9P4MVS8_9PLEO|nr:hypothetical protein GQ43DRAFT_173417 [Delitschia confertaspora ATCC 74209]
MSPKLSSTNEVILRDQSGWKLWIYAFKRNVEAGDVWERIDPNQTHRLLNRSEKSTRPTAATPVAIC